MSKDYTDFRTWFDHYSDQQLIDRFNEDIGKPGWSSSRAEFAGAMIYAFEKRSFDSSAILKDGCLSRRNRVMLVDNKVIVDPVEEMLNPFQNINPGLLTYPFKATGTLQLPGEEKIKVDIALTAVEIFQNISGIRKPEDLRGMVLCFKHSTIAFYCLLLARFDFKAYYIRQDSEGNFRISSTGSYPFDSSVRSLNLHLMNGFTHIILLPGLESEMDRDIVGARLTADLLNGRFVITKD